MNKEELKPIDVSKYEITETGQVLKMSERQGLEKDYYADRPIEPYSDDDCPNDWANIAHYAEENLEKAFKQIVALEEELNYAKSHCLFHSDCPVQKENAELKSECRRCVYTDCPCVLSDYGKDRNGICNHFKDMFDENAELKEKLEGAVKVQKQLTEAKEIIKEFVDNVERYSINNEILDRADVFLKSEVEK